METTQKPSASYLNMIRCVQRPDLFYRNFVRDCIIAQLPACFVESLPETVQGYTKDQWQYWIEPPVEPVRPNSDIQIFDGIYTDVNGYWATRMAPRFLNGVSIAAEKVEDGEELIVGNVYVAVRRNEEGEMVTRDIFRHEGVTSARWHQRDGAKFPAGFMMHRAVMQYDANPHPLPMHGCSTIPLPQDWSIHAGWPMDDTTYPVELYRFLSYYSFEELAPPTKAIEHWHNWDAWMQRHIEWEAKRQREKDKRRERRAAKKRQQAGIPAGLGAGALVFVPRRPVAVPTPGRKQAA